MRLRFKIPLYAMVTIIVLVIAAVVFVIKSHFIENQVNKYMAKQLAAKYGLKITIGEIDGSFVNGFRLRDVLAQFENQEDSAVLAYIPQINIFYQFDNIWHKKWIVDSLFFMGPQLYLRQDSSGRWMLPQISGGKGGSSAKPPPWQVDKLRLRHAGIRIARTGDSLDFFDINLAAVARFESETYTFAIDSLDFNSSDKRLRLKYANARGTIHKGNMALDNVYIETDSSMAAFDLARNNEDKPTYDVDIDSANISVTEIASYLNLNLDGRLAISGKAYHKFDKTGGDVLLRGTFQGRKFDSLNVMAHYDRGILYLDSLNGVILGGCGIAGFGDIDFESKPEVFHLDADVDSFNLNGLVAGSFFSNLNGHVIAEGRGLKSKTMAIDLSVDLGESYFDEYHFLKAAGDMTITNNALHLFPEFKFVYYDNDFYCEGDIDYDGAINVSANVEFEDLRQFENQTFIKEPSGRAKASFSFTGNVKDPDLSGVFYSDSIWLYQLYSDSFMASFKIDEFTSGKRGDVEVYAFNGNAWGLPFDSIYARLEVDSNLVFLDSVTLDNQMASSYARGVLDYDQYPQVLNLNDVAVDLSGRMFRSDGDQRIRIDSAGFLFDRINLKATDGRLVFGGKINYDETLDLSWDVENVALGPWVDLVSDSIDVNGIMISQGRIHGEFENPAFVMFAEVDSLHYRDLYLGYVETFLTYEDSSLYIDSLYLRSPGGVYSATGDLPINIKLSRDIRLFDDRLQDINITARDVRLDLVSFVLESVEYIEGDYTAEINLTGQPLKPIINGRSTLKNGTVKLLELRDPLRKVDVELEMENYTVFVNKATGIFDGKDKKAVFNATGNIQIQDIKNFRYNLNIDARSIPIRYELGDFEGTADARLSVKGVTPPRVNGTIHMYSAYYRENFAAENSGFNLLSALEADKSWDLDIMVECPSNCWVKNNDLDAEFSGEINIIRNKGQYNFLGELEIIRGKYYFFARTFNISEGARITYNNIEEPDPELYIPMWTRMRTQQAFSDFESEGNYSYTLEILITGRLSNPNIVGTGETPISSEKIIPALWRGYASTGQTGGQSPDTNPFTTGLSGILAGQFTRLGARSLGVETFEISPGYGKSFDPGTTRLTIGAYTLPNLYVFGSSYFNVDKGQEVGVEYRLGRNYLFEGRRDEFNLYHFNFKWYIEW